MKPAWHNTSYFLSLSLSVVVQFWFNFLDAVLCSDTSSDYEPFFSHTQRHMGTFNQCSFTAITLICHLLSRLLGCCMTDFCLAMLWEETRDPCIKGTIFRKEGSKSDGEGGLVE